MADSPLHSTSSVAGPGGFPARPQPWSGSRPAPREQGSQPSADRVSLEPAVSLARRLLRERVLARTRARLELDDASAGPEFAEVLDCETLTAFLGRLLSAQNQLAARRAGTWPAPRVRRCLDAALQAGAAETLELLAAQGHDDASAVAVVVDVLAEYGRRLAALAAPPHQGEAPAAVDPA